uniref:Cytokine receptor-like factor 3 n=1 Tax=Colobus angolensis palliatus TaxID=336983 RepID=A0A2K5I4P4_COLAP
MRQMMELDPELLLQEALENVELGHQLEGLWESASQTRDVLKQHINDLKGTLAKLLDERLVTLLQEVGTIKQTIKSPLDDCQKLIEHRVNTPEALVRKGEIATVGGVGEENEKLWSFTKKALHVQLDSIQEVPLLVDVPCLSVQLDDSILNIMKDHILKHGTVASRPPVQIEELIEKPGGIIVQWCNVDDNFTAQDDRLQFRKCTSNHFEDVYVGFETEFIVLHIGSNVDGDGRQEWSPWSVPQIVHSIFVPHEWTVGFERKGLSNQRNTSCRNDSEYSGVLDSRAPTYFSGQTLIFRVETLLAITSVSTVTFDIEAMTLGTTNNNEGRNINSNNRVMIFDWSRDQSCGSLYFGC